MRKSYDFSTALRNPHAKRLMRRVTLQIDEHTIEYFKSLSKDVEITYPKLIHLYLRDCALSGRRLKLDWKRRSKRRAV